MDFVQAVIIQCCSFTPPFPYKADFCMQQISSQNVLLKQNKLEIESLSRLWGRVTRGDLGCGRETTGQSEGQLHRS